jgi:tetratricopeptide (TPR) repeat protein
MKNPFSPLGRRGRASRANDRGGSLRDMGKKAEAIASYQRAMAIDPTWSAPFYNLGLLHKYESEWQPSLDANLRATELNPEDQAGWWNLGIAATALGQWDVARRAWRGAGLQISEGEGPIDFPCGYNPIRLDPKDEGETVWAHRLDPARARISSIPLGDYCFGDIVLNDGAAMGYRKLEGEDVPVFNCLALLEPSPLSTWCMEMELVRKASVSVFDALDEIASQRGLAMEDWTRSIRILCKACSEGTPHEHHDEQLQKAAPKKPRQTSPATAKAPSKLHRIAIAARTKGEVNDLLADWDPDARGVRVGDVEMEFSHA